MILAGCASHVSFPSRDIQVSGRLYKPQGAGPHAAVVLLPTCGGLTRHVTEDWPDYLVGLGYVVLTVDTLGSRGHLKCTTMGDRFEGPARDAYAALDWLAAQPFVDARRVAAVGFSLGAISINELIMMRPPRPAGKPEFKAFASFYGRCASMNPYLMRDSPLLQIIPEHDNFAARCIERAKTIRMEAHVLAGAHHAFDNPQMTSPQDDHASNRMLYSLDATRESQALLREFLARTLK
jgi:dienelactone hydrolase